MWQREKDNERSVEEVREERYEKKMMTMTQKEFWNSTRRGRKKEKRERMLPIQTEGE